MFLALYFVHSHVNFRDFLFPTVYVSHNFFFFFGFLFLLVLTVPGWSRQSAAEHNSTTLFFHRLHLLLSAQISFFFFPPFMHVILSPTLFLCFKKFCFRSPSGK